MIECHKLYKRVWTVSGAAAMVIAGSLPADLTIERLDSFQRVAARIHEAESKDEWKKRWIMDSIVERQRRWTEETKTVA